MSSCLEISNQTLPPDSDCKYPKGPCKQSCAEQGATVTSLLSTGFFRRFPEALQDVNLGPERGAMERQRTALVEALRRFALERHQQKWTAEQAGAALLTYVQSQAAPLLAAAVAGRPFAPPKVVRHADIIVSRFVLSTHDQEPTLFACLETFVKGHMLANVLYLPEGLSEVGRRFGQTAFYLDTPVVLRAVGYANPTISRPSQELLELLRGYDATLRIFEHTQREIEGVLDSAALSLRKGRKTAYEGSVYEHFVTERWSRRS